MPAIAINPDTSLSHTISDNHHITDLKRFFHGRYCTQSILISSIAIIHPVLRTNRLAIEYPVLLPVK
jgi:hypothetical protein